VGVDEIELARAAGDFVPVAEPDELTVPQGVAGVSVAVDEAHAESRVERPVCSEQLQPAVGQPCPVLIR